MRHGIIVGILSAVALVAACTTTNVNTGSPTGAGNGSGDGGGSTGKTTTTHGSGGSTMTSTTTTSTTTMSTTTPSTTSSSGGEGGATGYCAMPRSGEDCSSCPNGQTCGTCCFTAVPNGDVAYAAFLYTDCGCADTAPCHDECSGVGDVCPGLQNAPSQACGTCISNLSGNTPCIVTFNSDCANDQNCTLFNACLYSCPP